MTYTFDHFVAQNPWRVDEQALNLQYFPRVVWSQITPHLFTGEPLLITGARETGKTALVQSLVHHLIKDKAVDPGTIFYFNLDDLLTIGFFRDSLRVLNFLRCFKPRAAERIFLLIDELQNLTPEVGASLRAASGIKLIGTSSWAGSLARAETRTRPVRKSDDIGNNDNLGSKRNIMKLSNGARLFYLGPCNFREFLGATLKRQNYYLPELTNHPEALQMSASYAPILPRYLEEYVLYGGYPRVVRLMTPATKQEALREILQVQLSRLAQGAETVAEPDKFINLLTLLAAQHGQLLNLKTLSQQALLDWRTTRRYLKIMQEHYLVAFVYPSRHLASGHHFVPFYNQTDRAVSSGESGQPSSRGVPHIYFNDAGLRNILLGSFNELNLRADRAVLLENFLYQELRGWSEVTGLGFSRVRGGLVVFSFLLKGACYCAAVRYDFPESKHGMKALVNLAQRIKPVRVIVLTRDYLPPDKYAMPNFIFLPAYWVWALPEVLQA